MRDKKTVTTPGSSSAAPWSPKRFGNDDRERELAILREDLQASKDEGAASKEVIAVLRKQVESLQKETETL